MKNFMLYCQSEKEGDAVMMEYIMFKLLPAFRFAGKTNIFNTTVKVIERHYALFPYVLQQVRVNHTRHQRGGVDSQGYRTPNKGMDDLMERLMPHMKAFHHEGTYDSWARVSMELVCGMMCKQFTTFYTKLRGDAECEEVERLAEKGGDNNGEMPDPLWSMKKTTMPSKR